MLSASWCVNKQKVEQFNREPKKTTQKGGFRVWKIIMILKRFIFSYTS